MIFRLSYKPILLDSPKKTPSSTASSMDSVSSARISLRDNCIFICTRRLPQPMRKIHKSLIWMSLALILTSLRCLVQTPSADNQSKPPSRPRLPLLRWGPTDLKATPPSRLPRLHSFMRTSHPSSTPGSPADVATSQPATSLVYTIIPGSTPSPTAVLFSSRSRMSRVPT